MNQPTKQYGGVTDSRKLMETTAVKPIKKITVKSVCGGVDIVALVNAHQEKPGQVVPLMDVFGMASDFKAGSNDMGDYVKFVGQFKATNVKTGEQFRSGACILPGAIPDMVYGALKMHVASTVQFGFKIGAKFDEKSVTKYVYDIESLMPVSENDPLELLEKTLTVPQLAAPAQAAKPLEAAKPAEPAAAGKGAAKAA